MYLVVGLGNPGKNYSRTRHNVGYRVADEFCRRNRIWLWRRRFYSRFGAGRVGSAECAVIKPHTFMNRSGYAVAGAADKLRVAPVDIVVISDDISLPTGRVRLRRSGSSGGHRGLESVIHELGTDAFPRLRVGVGDPGETDPSDYVLSPFTAEEDEAIEKAVTAAARALELFITEGIEQAMAEFN